MLKLHWSKGKIMRYLLTLKQCFRNLIGNLLQRHCMTFHHRPLCCDMWCGQCWKVHQAIKSKALCWVTYEREILNEMQFINIRFSKKKKQTYWITYTPMLIYLWKANRGSYISCAVHQTTWHSRKSKQEATGWGG